MFRAWPCLAKIRFVVRIRRTQINNKIIRTDPVRIGIVGGTGGMGGGFALRWSRDHEILVGSRDAGRASEAAARYAETAGAAHGTSPSISGVTNEEAASADVLVLSIPYGQIDAVCPGVLEKAGPGCTVISPIVPMKKTDTGFEFIPMADGLPPAHEAVSKHMRDPSMLVSAFHAVSEKKLEKIPREVRCDIFVCGDGKRSVDLVKGLVSEIPGLNPVYLGPGRLAYLAEMATPLLLNAMIRGGPKNPGISLS